MLCLSRLFGGAGPSLETPLPVVGQHRTIDRRPRSYPVYTPEDYVPIFKRSGVSIVIRLNKEG